MLLPKAALNDCYSEVTAYTVLVLTHTGLVSTTLMDATSRPLSIPTTAAIQKPLNLFNQSYVVYITPHHATSY